jgi:predicted O-methyltransferase YrrM
MPLDAALKATAARIPQAWTPQPHARDAALCRWTGQPTHDRGVVVGVIPEQAWMLGWWLANFRKHNPDLPVAFADFGLGDADAQWCAAHGLHFKVQTPESVKAWFRKPFAILQAPFREILWLDLDCEVRGPVAKFLDYTSDNHLVVAGRNVLAQNYDTAQMHGWWLMLPKADADASNAMVACTGIVGTAHGHPAIAEWALNCVAPTEFAYKGDHEILAVVLHRRNIRRHQVTGEEFTLARFPVTQTPIIMHHAGVPAKRRLMEVVDAERQGRGHMCPDEHERLMALVRDAAASGRLRILEIGVAEGKTGTAMMRTAIEAGADVTYVGVDLNTWQRAEFPDIVRNGCNLHFIEGQSQGAVAQVKAISATFDVVLIDGCHCLKCATADRDLYAPMVAEGGYLVFHDTRRPLEDLSAQPGSHHRGHGVRPVYDETKAREEWVEEADVGKWGLGILRRSQGGVE